MLLRPSSCVGCPLHPIASGFMNPALSQGTPYRVALVGEALGEDEVIHGAPFVGRAGFKLTRLLEWAGLDRSRFDIWNVAWCRPPGNQLEGQPYEFGAINHCKTAHWEKLLSRVDVVVPMGNVPLHAFTGRKGILATRGYVRPGPGATHLIPTVHPSFIQRGQSKYSAAFIHDVQKAVRLASEGIPFEQTNFTLDPPPGVAYRWAQDYLDELAHFPDTMLAYDIETPGKGEDEGDLDEDDDPTYTIHRIGFAYKPGVALSVPFESQYFAAIRLLLESGGEKVVWNGGFDNPRLRAAGFPVRGLIHDGMVAWHVLHSDLPKGLGFVATFTCPFQQEWKHLSHKVPAFYNATDADVELKSMIALKAELVKVGLWDVYDQDVLQLDPILHYMENQGMPIDPEVRLDRAIRLAEKQSATMIEMESVVPLMARRIEHVYKKAPTNTANLIARRAIGSVVRCSACGHLRPTKSHFKAVAKPTEKKPQNLCAKASRVTRDEEVVVWERLAAFKPSREQLIRYQQTMDRPVPTTFDRKLRVSKPSMNEKALKGLMLKYPLDRLYPLVLVYRELDKLAGTYIGRAVVKGAV